MSSRLPVLGYAGAESAARDDDVAREEPLEIQVGGGRGGGGDADPWA
jgi:hypothetical protein